jgi:hypothetical protein
MYPPPLSHNHVLPLYSLRNSVVDIGRPDETSFGIGDLAATLVPEAAAADWSATANKQQNAKNAE